MIMISSILLLSMNQLQRSDTEQAEGAAFLKFQKAALKNTKTIKAAQKQATSPNKTIEAA